MGKSRDPGGYNPMPWTSIGDYNFNLGPTNAGRTAFIYNLSTAVKRDQKQDAGTVNNYGRWQTYNHAQYGPTFGGGSDIGVNSTLSQGIEHPYSYGPGTYQTGDQGLLPNNVIACGGACNHTAFTVGALEVYTFQPSTAVPEPASLPLVASGLTALLALSIGLRRTV